MFDYKTKNNLMRNRGESPRQDSLRPNERGALRRLSYSRLTVTALLILATWWWRSSFSSDTGGGFSFDLALLYAVSLGFSFLNIAATRTQIASAVLARIQLFGDLVMITALVALTGGASAPSATLYIMTVAASGYFLKREETLLLSVTGAAGFISVVLSDNWDKLIKGDGLGSDISQTLALTVAGILIVGLLAGRVADRKNIGDTLKETIESLDKLKILHERIIESMQTGLVATDLKGVVYDANQAAMEMSGLAYRELIGRNVTEILGEKMTAALIKLNRIDADSDAEESFECTLAGTRSPEVRCKMSPLLGTNGSVSGFVVTFEDLTEIRQMEESVKRSDRLAAVGRMAAGLAHEIRNPLGSMGSALQFLRERSNLDDADRELLDVALKESNRLDEIIRNFLTYAKPGTAVFGKDSKEAVDLSVLLNDCATLLRHSPEIKETHAIILDLPDTRLAVRGNEVQIKQIFWNIARNAVAAMPDGGSLTIRIERSTDRPWVFVVFKDNGIGIPPDRLDRLFEPFSEDATGTGLGLSIVRKIVTEHGGDISIESSEGTGTEVRLGFPLSGQGE
jgi:two-component system sensor histidine kinase PilS (NtrC family)